MDQEPKCCQHKCGLLFETAYNYDQTQILGPHDTGIVKHKEWCTVSLSGVLGRMCVVVPRYLSRQALGFTMNQLSRQLTAFLYRDRLSWSSLGKFFCHMILELTHYSKGRSQSRAMERGVGRRECKGCKCSSSPTGPWLSHSWGTGLAVTQRERTIFISAP